MFVSARTPGMLSTFVKAARLQTEPATADSCAFYLKAWVDVTGVDPHDFDWVCYNHG